MNQSEKKGFRRFLPLIFLIAMLALAVVFVLLLPYIKEKYPSKTAQKYTYNPTYQMLAEHDESTLESIIVSHSNGETYMLLYQNETLLLDTGDGESEPVNPIIAGHIITYATKISIEDTVAEDESEVAEQLSDMGLQPPQIEVIATYADGSSATISLGYNLPSTSFYYCQWSGDNGVYLCSSGVYDVFGYTAEMLLSVTQLSIIPSMIERVSISHGDGEPIVCTFETDNENTVTGTLQSPFVYPMAAEATETLFSAVENFRFGTRLMPVTDSNATLYGFDSPQAVVKIAQRAGLYSKINAEGVLQSYPLEPSLITLTIGDADGEFFVYCEHEGICYRVSSFLVAAFLKADAEEYVSLNPADPGAAVLQSIVVQTGNGTLNVRAAYTEQVLPNNELETDEDGNVIYTVDITANGEVISTDTFDALAERLKQMTVSGMLDSVTEPDGTPRWQMTITTLQGKTRTLAAYPMDSFHDILAVNGVALSFISNEALEIALGEFSALPEPTETP